ncbi:MAG TPA: SDR family NAD(P)-dependent oxidoreductase [Baekduia sp.]|uniref:SDR family NAD(P)-dependent oxidoreductase n=1 Tax=Baekduia sp. TaxID=2600305 RepID=UPI002D7920F8|nr:SDR family NAD(P)-dependent oxidoreductase [Baekduia sp.]HET6507994.1 SDR family NAD(P)-dependent oxidoreductase [Baekduia sp.]
MPEPIVSGLADRVVIVTGAAGGIGREVVALLHEAGARVLAVDVAQEPLDALLAELGAPEGRHVAVAGDLKDLAWHAALVERARDELGGPHALVHAAAVLRRRDSIDDITEDDWDAQVDTNLKATFFLNRTVAQALIAGGEGGRIVNFTSQGWQSGGFGGSVVYAATKGGVVSMSRGLARALAPHGITVNTVAPGAADTAMMRGGQTDEQLADFVKMIPLGRMAQPREVAASVLFLVSDHAAYITGATLNVSGGQLMY